MKKIYGIVFVLIVAVSILGYLYVAKDGVVKKDSSYKVGIVVRGQSYAAGVDGFKSKMVELGYEEGKNISYDVRFVEKGDEIPSTVAEVIKGEVDLLLAFSTPVTIEAAKQTKTIPIVFGSMGDAVASGLVNSLNEPGKNVTGILSLSVETAGKRLELLKELFPQIKKVASALTPTDIPGRRSLEVIGGIAPKLGVQIVTYEIIPPQTPTSIAATIFRKDVDGIVLASDSATWAVLPAYVAQAKKEKLPFAVFDKDMVEKGGLVGYGPDYYAVGGQAAILVKKIFEGADPAKLPVETPVKLILALNLKTARELNLSIPEAFLAKVDYLVK